MNTIQNKLQKFSNVVYVFAKIGYIASIIGVCLCAVSLVWVAVTGNPSSSVQIFGINVYGPIDADGMNLADIGGNLSYILTYCAFLIAVMRMMMKLFGNMRDNYTPFTTENAELFKRMAIWMIPASIVPATVGQTVGMACAKTMSLTFTGDYGDGFSVVSVLVLFTMSMVFRYGCALQDQADTTL